MSVTHRIDPASAAIGAMLHSSRDDAAAALELLRDTDPGEALLREILRAVRGVVADGKNPQVHDVAAWLSVQPGMTRARLHDLTCAVLDLATDAPVGVLAEHYAKVVVADAVRRALVEVADRLRQVADSGSVADLHAVAVRSVSDLAEASHRIGGNAR